MQFPEVASNLMTDPLGLTESCEGSSKGIGPSISSDLDNLDKLSEAEAFRTIMKKYDEVPVPPSPSIWPGASEGLFYFLPHTADLSYFILSYHALDADS